MKLITCGIEISQHSSRGESCYALFISYNWFFDMYDSFHLSGRIEYLRQKSYFFSVLHWQRNRSRLAFLWHVQIDWFTLSLPWILRLHRRRDQSERHQSTSMSMWFLFFLLMFLQRINGEATVFLLMFQQQCTPMNTCETALGLWLILWSRKISAWCRGFVSFSCFFFFFNSGLNFDIFSF